MTIRLIDPEGLPKVEAYHHVSVATGSRLVFLAGQVAWDADGNTVGVGDLAAQVEQCVMNVATALAAVGATLDDVAKLTFYAVDWTADKMPSLMEGFGRAAAKLGTVPAAPATLIGVSSLDIPEHLVEIEATAVLD